MSIKELVIETSDGVTKAALLAPDGGAKVHGGVILYMDIFGPRPALHAMGQRLADAGYLVLVPDVFYRHAPYGPYDAATAMKDLDTRAELMSMKDSTTLAMTSEDTAAFIDALTKEGATGPLAAVGYCMGGARALTVAASHTDRIRAAASFHGGQLATDAPDSPHLAADRITGKLYIGSAGVDGSFPPASAGLLAEALREAEVDYVMENYVGVAHGWAVTDHGAFDHDGSERHWKRLLTFLEDALG